MLDGNARFLAGAPLARDSLAEMRSSSAGQYPAAVVLSCVDSRAPVEVICDLGLGDTFNARVAGNAVNDDILGSMEFACAAAGAKTPPKLWPNSTAGRSAITSNRSAR